LYLQAITVSDIVNAQGTCILQSAIEGEREPSRVSSLHWPKWQRPSSWNSWKRLLHHISTRGRLVQKLGDWVSSTHQEWQWYYEASQDAVYHQRPSRQWVKYTRVKQLRLTRRSRTLYTSPQDYSPPSFMSLLFPTSVVSVSENTIHSLPSSSPMFSKNQVGDTSLWSPDQVPPALEGTPTFYQQILGPTPPTSLQCAELAEALRQDQELLGCSDGSYVEDTGRCYHGWILASKIRRTIVEGCGPGHGQRDLLSSYRAELCGILALLYVVQRICNYHAVTTGKLRLHCDNKSALAKTGSIAPRGITPFLTADYDLIALIQLQTTLLPISVACEWVKGHYTGNKREYKHDLNERADLLATSAHDRMPPTFYTTQTVAAPPGYRVRLSNGSGLITSQYYKMLAEAHHSQPIVDYILRKTGWNITIFNRVDWDSHHRAFRRLTRFQRISVTKIVHQLSNTNRQNKLLYDKSDKCPCCGIQEETFQHVLKCTAASTQSLRQEALFCLEKLLATIGTPALVISVIMGGFRDWLVPNFLETRRSRPTTFGSL
jgi:ribonuclease HI